MTGEAAQSISLTAKWSGLLVAPASDSSKTLLVLSKSCGDTKKTTVRECNLQKESYFMDTNVDINEKGGFRNLRNHATSQKHKKSDIAYLKQIC